MQSLEKRLQIRKDTKIVGEVYSNKLISKHSITSNCCKYVITITMIYTPNKKTFLAIFNLMGYLFVYAPNKYNIANQTT